MSESKYHLDAHCEAILEEYREHLQEFNESADKVHSLLKKVLDKAGLVVASIEHRVKTEKSLAGKLELKGAKYTSLKDITDIIGVRVITFYSDDVDKVASAVDRLFDVDWENSVDKRKAHEIDSFGYMSLHYICSIEGFPYRFEIQMRTVLQHAWANMNHDTGYKSGVEVPREYLRSINRLAGMLELADEQFSHIRREINDYRRNVQSLVASGNFDDVPLNGDTFRSYLALDPYRALITRIADINQAEVYKDNFIRYLDVLLKMGFTTLGSLDRLKKECAEGAYQLALHQFAGTDLDILAYSVALQNLCIVHLINHDGSVHGLQQFFMMLGDTAESSRLRAQRTLEQAEKIHLI